MYFINILM